jgi:acetyltransferase-like isoleucine patch superfamily enzyme
MNSGKTVRILVLETLGPLVQRLRYKWLRLKGYRNISSQAIIERNVNLDRVYPSSVFVGAGSLVASEATLLCHEHVFRDPSNSHLPLHKPVRIGARCFVGVSAMVLPGVTIGDDCIIGAGSIVTKDIPSGSVAVGNPARVIRSGIELDERAILRLVGAGPQGPSK